ncbi:MAG: Skp family chaperone for outer membrane protein [Phycisphaerales bacterium]|jgi:Skp family chaperone for outer membrane proteins
MQKIKLKSYSSFVLVLLVVSAVAWKTEATKWLVPSNPTVTVTINFELLFASLEERVFEESKVQAIVEDMNAEIEQRRQEITEYEQEFELYEAGSQKWQELLQDQQLKVLEYQAQVEYSNSRKARELSKGTRRVYMNIRESAAKLAEQNGWDYVVVNDAAITLPEGDNVDIGLEISSRRILYANDALDVTDQLISYMNGNFDEMAVR